MKCVLAVIAVALLHPLHCFSQSFAIHGFEDMSCGAWAKSGQTPKERAVYLWWIRGFVSGYNFGSPANQVQLSRMPSQETVALYVDKYCQEQPLNMFVGAAFELVNELAPTPVSGKGAKKPSSRNGP